MTDLLREQELRRRQNRRLFIKQAAAGTVVVGLGNALFRLADAKTNEARAEVRADGRPRLPPGQRVLEKLRPMGGRPGSPLARDFTLRIHGEVEKPFVLNFDALTQLNPVEETVDVHCVTGWSVLGAKWKGVRISDLAKKAGLKGSARHVILEAAHGYTANVPLRDAMGPHNLVTWELDGHPLPRQNGGPVRGLVPDLYFWKSAKWITGIRFVTRDRPGFWEVRGYHNRGNPWREERYG